MSAAGAAFGIIGAGIPLIAGFLVLDAIAGTVRCTTCGSEMHHSKQTEHKGNHAKKERDIDEDLGFGGLGVSFPDISWEGF